MQIRVVNKHLDRQCVEGGARVYIGRPSVLGNPFVLGRDGGRDQVIARYRAHLEQKLAGGDSAITAEIDRLAAVAQTQQLELACFCAPAACHGDVIKDVLTQRLAARVRERLTFGDTACP